MRVLVRLAGAAVLGLVAASTPVMGFAAAEHYESRKFYSVFEGDWFLPFGLLAGITCLWGAVRLLRGIRWPAVSA